MQQDLYPITWRQALERTGHFFDFGKWSGRAKLLIPPLLAAFWGGSTLGLQVLLPYVLIVFLYFLLLALVNRIRVDLAKIHEKRARRKALENRRKTKLEFLFHARKDPFRQYFPYDHPLAIGGDDRSEIGYRLLMRVGVQNISDIESVEDVTVELENLEPNRLLSLPVRLRQMHATDAHDLAPSQIKYFDVVSFFYAGPYRQWREGLPEIQIHHTVPDVLDHIPTDDYILTLVAYAKNVTGVRKQFRIGRRDDAGEQNYYFEEVPSNPQIQ